MEKKKKHRKKGLLSDKIFPPQTCHCPLECVFCSARFGLIFLMPWNIYMFGYINKENRTKQNDAHTTHTTQNRIVFLCFAFSVTQIVAIISLALQAFSFILKAVFGIMLHLTQFNKYEYSGKMALCFPQIFVV